MILFSSVEVIFSFKGKGNNVVVQRFSQAFNKVDPDQAMEWIHAQERRDTFQIEYGGHRHYLDFLFFTAMMTSYSPPREQQEPNFNLGKNVVPNLEGHNSEPPRTPSTLYKKRKHNSPSLREIYMITSWRKSW